MPWLGAEPYEQSFLQAVEPRTIVPVSDDICWQVHPRLNWLYDRLQIAQCQELYCGPCGIDPKRWPLITRPIINLTGLSQGVEVHCRPRSLDHLPGHFWSEILPEPQYSVDVIVDRGELRWLCATRCYELKPGIFRGFQVGVELPRSIREVIVGFVDCYLPKHVGAMNFELRDGVVIEVHLRPSLQYIEFYGPAFLESWARLCDGDGWKPPVTYLPGFSIPVYDHWRTDRLHSMHPVTKVYTGDDPWHPPGCYRTGYVNAHDRDLAILVARSLGTTFF